MDAATSPFWSSSGEGLVASSTTDSCEGLVASSTTDSCKGLVASSTTIVGAALRNADGGRRAQHEAFQVRHGPCGQTLDGLRNCPGET